jgi:hypothetical protein
VIIILIGQAKLLPHCVFDKRQRRSLALKQPGSALGSHDTHPPRSIRIFALLTVADGKQDRVPSLHHLHALAAERMTWIHFVMCFLDVVKSGVDEDVG